MTKDQYRAALVAFNLTIVGAAPYLGISPRQSQRMAAGEPIPKPVAKLIAVCLANKIDITTIGEQ